MVWNFGMISYAVRYYHPFDLTLYCIKILILGRRPYSDIKTFFESNNFTATADNPVAMLYHEMYSLYPNAKFIHTQREPHSWYRSMKAIANADVLLFKAIAENPWVLFTSAPYFTRGRSLNHLIASRVYQNRFSDEDYVCKQFERHTENVIATIPADQLLVLDMSKGWEPLCAFLQVPIPDVPFPRENNAESFTEMVQQQLAIAMNNARWAWYQDRIFSPTTVSLAITTGIIAYLTLSNNWPKK